jgi:hypothetical protein
VRARLTVLGAVLLVAGCGGSGSKPPTPPPTPPPTQTGPAPPATAKAGDVKATMIAPGHTVKVNAYWRYRVKVTDRAGHPLSGKITVQIVDPLGRPHPATYDNTNKPITRFPFRGSFHDYLQFPASGRGFQLTIRVIVKTAKGAVTLSYPVTPK